MPGAPLNFGDFSAGMYLTGETSGVAQHSDFTPPPNALLQAINVEFLESGGVRGRRGQALFDTLAGEVRGLVRRYPRDTSRNDERGSLTTDGLQFPGVTFANDPANGGTASWFIPMGSPIYCPQSIISTSKLMAIQGLGFAVPAGATILGIGVFFQRFAQAGGTVAVYDANVQLIKGGVAQGNDNSRTTVPWEFKTTAEAWYGAPDDLWGLTLTPADVNATNFGIAIAVQTKVNGLSRAILVRYAVIIAYTLTATPSTLAVYWDGSDQRYRDSTGGAFAAITGGSGYAHGMRPRFVAWPERNKVYIFDGINPVLEYDGDSIAVTATGSSGVPPRRGPYACLYRNRILATEPSELGFSIYATSLNDPTDWPPRFQISVNDPEGGDLAGLFTIGDTVIILHALSQWRFQGDVEFGATLVRYSDKGCVAADSAAATPFGVIYHGIGGIYLTNGYDEPQLVSPGLAPLFLDRNEVKNYPNAVGWYYPPRQQYFIRLDLDDAGGWVLQRLDVQGRSGPEVRLAWSYWDRLPGRVAASYRRGVDNGELFIGDTNGKVRQLQIGNTDDVGDYVSEIVTVSRAMSGEMRHGRLADIEVFYRGIERLGLGIRYDHAQTDTLTSSIGPSSPPAQAILESYRRHVLDQTKFGRFTSLRLRSPGGDGSDFELHQIIAQTQLRTGLRFPP